MELIASWWAKLWDNIEASTTVVVAICTLILTPIFVYIRDLIFKSPIQKLRVEIQGKLNTMNEAISHIKSTGEERNENLKSQDRSQDKMLAEVLRETKQLTYSFNELKIQIINDRNNLQSQITDNKNEIVKIKEEQGELKNGQGEIKKMIKDFNK